LFMLSIVSLSLWISASLSIKVPSLFIIVRSFSSLIPIYSCNYFCSFLISSLSAFIASDYEPLDYFSIIISLSFSNNLKNFRNTNSYVRLLHSDFRPTASAHQWSCLAWRLPCLSGEALSSAVQFSVHMISSI
jgi:hypothetical protein